MVSVIAVFFEMRREAARTLHTLSRAYQCGIDGIDYEVIAIDNGSRTQPLSASAVSSFGGNFRLITRLNATPSPAPACNTGAEVARGDTLLILVDGARMLSPGILHYTARAFATFPDPFVHTISMHLGPDVQNRSMLHGYDQDAEDALLDSIDWRGNGYRLFEVSSPAPTLEQGFFMPLAESNCIALRRDSFHALGGFDERFASPGGGLVNLDFFSRAMGRRQLEPVRILGEATFHQVHGGVATNVPPRDHPFNQFAEEYRRLRGHEYRVPARDVQYVGHLPPQTRRLIQPASAAEA
jgi:hypothetical protein